MAALEVPAENSAAWAKLCQLIGSRILEDNSRVQEATNDEREGDNNDELKS